MIKIMQIRIALFTIQHTWKAGAKSGLESPHAPGKAIMDKRLEVVL